MKSTWTMSVLWGLCFLVVGSKRALAESVPECVWVSEWNMERSNDVQQVLQHPIPTRTGGQLKLAKVCGRAGLATQRESAKQAGVSWKDFVELTVLQMREAFIAAANIERRLLLRGASQCRSELSGSNTVKTENSVSDAQDVVLRCRQFVEFIGDVSVDRLMGGETPVVGSAKSPWLSDINFSESEAGKLLKEARFELEAAKVRELRAMHQNQIANVPTSILVRLSHLSSIDRHPRLRGSQGRR